MVAQEKVNTSLFMGALGFSLLVHIAIAISVMNIEIPKAITRANFETWVKHISPTKREAIILPAVPKTVQNEQEAPVMQEPNQAKTSGEGAGKGEGASVPAQGKGQPGTPGKTGTALRSKGLRTSGILGLIGVASESSSGKGAIGDVFSANSGKVSDNLESVMEGKQRVELANSSNISRQALKGAGGGGKVSGAPEDIGGIASASSGKVQSGHRQESDLPVPKVQNSGAKTVSGNADSQSVLGVIARKNSGFTRCYERALRNNPDLAGKVGYELSVSEDGQVLDVKFIEDSLRSKEVTDCIKGILLRLIFPAPKGGPAIFSSVLVFGTN